MRWLVIAVALVAALWSGWWFVGRAAFERGAVAGIEAARARGWDVAYADLSVTGFPNRFDTTLDAPAVMAPGGAWGWSAPFLQVFALAYRPTELIAVAPDAMVVATPAGPLDVTAGDLRASVAVSPSLEPEILRATVAGEALAASGLGLDAALGRGQLALRQAGGAGTYDVAVSLSDLQPGEALRAAIDPFATLPATIAAVEADLLATLDRPLGPGAAPRVRAIDLRAARLAWGDLRAEASGQVRVDAAGVPEGVVTLDVAGWQAALRLAAAAGALPPERLPLVTAGLAGMAGEDGRLTLDLTLAEGEVRLGPITLGPAPRLPPPAP